MSQRPKEAPSDSPARTLGDVLEGSRRTAPTPEKHWVDLVQAIAAGDQRALRAVYSQTHRMVFTLVVRITGNRETAEELTLDVFHDVWRRASTYDPAGGSVVGWIMNQARSRAIDRLRFEHRKKRNHTGAEDPVSPAAAMGPDQALEVTEQGDLLRRALQVLTADERQVIETAFFSELTHVEVAERLNQPVGTVKTRIRSGLAKLRHALAGKLQGS